MFTGIVEEIGIVKKINNETLTIKANKVIEDVKIGDSILVNGVCETVTSFDSDSFTVNISPETFKVTTFSSLKSGEIVNLERALTLNSRLGGHIVSGHVDCRGQCVSIEKLSDFYNITFEIPEEFKKYIAQKGSVTINGISLTIAETYENIFKIAIIPHTLNNTNLKNLQTNDFVNIETDILAKYIEKMLSVEDNKREISMEFLADNGFV